MERKIGEVFEYEGKTVKCIESRGCDDCAFIGRGCNVEDLECRKIVRTDGVNASFPLFKPEHINDITDPVNPEPQMSYE